MKNVGRIFVYGTLKVGGFFSHRYDKYRLEAVPAAVKGTLYDLGAFPGVTLDGDGMVHGELHTYSNFRKIVRSFDYIEGHVGRNRPKDNLYNKNVINVTTESGHKTRAIVYTVNTQRIIIEECTVVESGTWSDYK